MLAILVNRYETGRDNMNIFHTYNHHFNHAYTVSHELLDPNVSTKTRNYKTRCRNHAHWVQITHNELALAS